MTKNLYLRKIFYIAYITLREDGVGSHSHTVYEGLAAVLRCQANGFPIPHVAWVRDGVVIQNKTTYTSLKWTVNDTKGSTHKYECHATNIHGKDYYPITVTVAGTYTCNHNCYIP